MFDCALNVVLQSNFISPKTKVNGKTDQQEYGLFTKILRYLRIISHTGHASATSEEHFTQSLSKDEADDESRSAVNAYRDPAIRKISVHAVLLPSGSILLASGSSSRNLGPIDTYPQLTNPRGAQGVFRKHEDPFHMQKIDDYYQLVNNVGIYDPNANTFYRVPHPEPVADTKWRDHFVPTDLFCTGHLHTPDGNVLFAGGTQYYYPFRTGHRAAFLFDWRKETSINWKKVDWRRRPSSTTSNNSNDPWIFSGKKTGWRRSLQFLSKYFTRDLGLMERGRWYPTLVPLIDGRLVVLAGFVGFDAGYPEMYSFENNHFVEFFETRSFNKSNPQTAWKRVNVKSTLNGPFTNRINADFRPTPDVNCSARCVFDNQYDAFKLYEQGLIPSPTDSRISLVKVILSVQELKMLLSGEKRLRPITCSSKDHQQHRR